MEDEKLRNVLENWEELSLTQEQYYAYKGRLKQIYDDAAFKTEMELRLEKGLEEGLKEGVNKETETIARQLLKAGMEINFVAESTGLEK